MTVFVKFGSSERDISTQSNDIGKAIQQKLALHDSDWLGEYYSARIGNSKVSVLAQNPDLDSFEQQLSNYPVLVKVDYATEELVTQISSIESLTLIERTEICDGEVSLFRLSDTGNLELIPRSSSE